MQPPLVRKNQRLSLANGCSPCSLLEKNRENKILLVAQTLLYHTRTHILTSKGGGVLMAAKKAAAKKPAKKAAKKK